MDSPALDVLQARLHYTFRQPELLVRALTHPSLLQERPQEKESNQRLEFLGDAVLQLILTEALFSLYPTEREGALSKRRAALSKGEFLAELASEIDLGPHLRFGQSEEMSGGRERPAALEDAFEALVGAVFTDSDYPTTRQVVLRIYGSLPDRLSAVTPGENPKGRLQERVQPVYGNAALQYVCEHIAGEDHAREYEARVYLQGRLLGTGRGSSKKSAEESAAREALENLPAVAAP
jgi:ribonuclease III